MVDMSVEFIDWTLVVLLDVLEIQWIANISQYAVNYATVYYDRLSARYTPCDGTWSVSLAE